MSLDVWLKVSQIVFFLVTGLTLVLTYLGARRVLLNAINTEYQKQVIVRLGEIARELGSEFDDNSPNHWIKASREIKRIVIGANADYFAWKGKGSKGTFRRHRLGGKDEARFENLANTIKSDPFIPKSIREPIVAFLERRVEVLETVRNDVIAEYKSEIQNGLSANQSDSNASMINNRINHRLNEQGWGIDDVEDKVNRLRTLIQEYFESFNPLAK